MLLSVSQIDNSSPSNPGKPYTMSTDVIVIAPKIPGGKPVFRRTCVPVESLSELLEKGISVDEFLEDFPALGREKVILVLETAEMATTSKNLKSPVG